CISPRRDLPVGRVPFPVKSGMAPTVGSTVGPVMNANGVVPGPAPGAQNLLNQLQNNMISELPANSAQREILNTMLQAQNFNPPTFDHQQLAHLHALQQQGLYAQQQATLAAQNRINQNGTISPSKIQPMSISNQIALRQKRPSQAEAFSHEPLSKRSVGSFPQGGNFPLQQLTSMTNSQQMALLQQMQQQNLPTSASMQMPTVGPRPQTRLHFPAQGFPSFNPTGGVLSQSDDAIQNYIRNMQIPGMVPPQRPPTDLAQIMALMAANSQPRANMNFDDLKRKEILPQIPGLDPNLLAQQMALRPDEQLRLMQLRNSPQQQLAFAALAQQNDQRRRSLPLVQPNPLGLSLLNPQLQAQSSLLTSTASETNPQTSGPQVSSPVKEARSTPSVSSTSPIQNPGKNGIESHSPSQLGPDEIRYQMFLHSIDLFNKKVVEEDNGSILSEKLEIPPQIVEAARYTHLAKIPVPSPSVSLDEIQPGWRGKLEGISKIAQTEIPNTAT
ncbi:hypothetical protein FO519_006090, partial [Halicephalobus sp. NKZ332]